LTQRILDHNLEVGNREHDAARALRKGRFVRPSRSGADQYLKGARGNQPTRAGFKDWADCDQIGSALDYRISNQRRDIASNTGIRQALFRALAKNPGIEETARRDE